MCNLPNTASECPTGGGNTLLKKLDHKIAQQTTSTLATQLKRGSPTQTSQMSNFLLFSMLFVPLEYQ